MENVDVLAIAAHPDDIELTCAGTLIKACESGILRRHSRPDSGRNGNARHAGVRAKEAEAARAVIGAKFRVHMNLGDATDRIDRKSAGGGRKDPPGAAEYRDPSPLGWPPPGPFSVCDAGYEACYAAGLKRIAGPGSPTGRKKSCTPRWSRRYGLRSWWISVPFFPKKLEAINCFASQFAGDMREITEIFPAWGRLIDRITTQCKYFGHLVGVDYAEPFVVKEIMAVDDL